MKSIKTTNQKIKKHFLDVYALKYCGEFTTPDGKKHQGIDPDDVTTFSDIIEEYTGRTLAPQKYYNDGKDGWNWTGYPMGPYLVITGYYRNDPSYAKPFEDIFKDFVK